MEQWRRNNLAAALSVFLLTAGFSFTIPFLPLYLQEIEDMSGEQAAMWAGVATALGGIGAFVSGPLWGILGDKVGRKPMLVRAAAGGAVGLAAFALAETTWQVLAIRSFVGIMAGAPAAAMALIAAGTPEAELPKALGSFQAVSLFGLAMGPAAAAVLIELFDYRGTFLLTAAVMLAGAVASVFLIREDKSTLRRNAGASPSNGLGELGELLRVPAIRATLGVALILGLGVPMVQPVLSSFIKELLEEGRSVNLVVGSIFFGISAAGGIGAMLTGRALRRVPTRRLLVVASAVAGLLLVPQAGAQAVWHLVPFVLGMAFFHGSLQASTVALVSSVVSRASASAGFGLYQSVQAASAQLAPAVGGLLVAMVGFRGVFVTAGAVLLVASFVAARVLPGAPAVGPAPLSAPAAQQPGPPVDLAEPEPA